MWDAAPPSLYKDRRIGVVEEDVPIERFGYREAFPRKLVVVSSFDNPLRTVTDLKEEWGEEWGSERSEAVMWSVNVPNAVLPPPISGYYKVWIL